MIHLFPANRRDEVPLRLEHRVANQSMSRLLFGLGDAVSSRSRSRMQYLLLCPLEEITMQTNFFWKTRCLPGSNCLQEFLTFRKCDVPPRHGLMFSFRCCVIFPFILTSDNMTKRNHRVPHWVSREKSKHCLIMLFLPYQRALSRSTAILAFDSLSALSPISYSSCNLRKFIKVKRRPHHASVRTFKRPSLDFIIHFLAIPSLSKFLP